MLSEHLLLETTSNTPSTRPRLTVAPADRSRQGTGSMIAGGASRVVEKWSFAGQTNLKLNSGCGARLIGSMDLKMLKRMDLVKFMLRSLLFLSFHSLSTGGR